MPTNDPRIDAYIDKAAPFAQPILIHLRKLVHKACPNIVETIKWSMPIFDHKGIVCSMASFKQHCAFGFWKQKILDSDAFPKHKSAMGSFGRITSLDDLPDDKTMTELIRQAVELNEKGIKVPKAKSAAKKEIIIPDDLSSVLSKNKKAKATFENFSYSHRKEYVEWINEAKTDTTRKKRIATTIEQLAEGKSRQWKYERKKK